MARSFVSASSQYLYFNGGNGTSYPRTISAWIYSKDVTNILNIAGANDFDNAQGVELSLRLRGDVAGDIIEAVADNGPSAAVAQTTTGVTINKWHHVAGVFSGTSERAVYIDGGSKGTNTTGIIMPTGVVDYSIGCRYTLSAPDRYFQGYIAEVAFWSVVLSDAEIYLLSKGFPTRLIRKQNQFIYVSLLNLDNSNISFPSNKQIDRFKENGITTLAPHPNIFNIYEPPKDFIGSVQPTEAAAGNPWYAYQQM